MSCINLTASKSHTYEHFIHALTIVEGRDTGGCL